MNGKQLFEYYTSKRDYSGNAADTYAQTLFTLYFHIQDDIYPLLEKAKSLNKQLSIIDDPETIHEYSIEDVVLVNCDL